MRPADRVFEEENLNRRTEMQSLKAMLLLTTGAVCFALAIVLLLSLPGLVSDKDSVVPIAHLQRVRP
jgi:hypothetical protein